jgi:hypothetical protein
LARLKDFFAKLAVSSGTFSAQLDGSLVVDHSDEVECEMAQDCHVGGPVPGVASRLFLTGVDVEYPERGGLEPPALAARLAAGIDHRRMVQKQPEARFPIRLENGSRLRNTATDSTRPAKDRSRC